jgi:hypothetical protein
VNILEMILLFWVAPGLFTFLIYVHEERKISGRYIQDYRGDDWAAAIAASILYPLGLTAYFCMVIWPALIKTRKLWWLK